MSEIVSGPGLHAEVHADRGARIVSLRSDDGWEWLVPSERTGAPGRGQPFVRPGMGGWDEVAPTVQEDPDAADSLGHPHAVLPDHGDVWNVPWVVDHASPTEHGACVDLESLPIRLERRITATATGLRLSYRASTSSTSPVPFLWCAHPQFSAGQGVSVRLEACGKTIRPPLVEMYPEQGKLRDFPADPLHEALAEGTSVKAFVDPEVRADAAVLTLPSGRTLRISWDGTRLPYLGLFWDNGEFAAEPVLAVEPSTGWGERLSTAARQERVLSVSQAQPLSWALELSV